MPIVFLYVSKLIYDTKSNQKKKTWSLSLTTPNPETQSQTQLQEQTPPQPSGLPPLPPFRVTKPIKEK